MSFLKIDSLRCTLLELLSVYLAEAGMLIENAVFYVYGILMSINHTYSNALLRLKHLFYRSETLNCKILLLINAFLLGVHLHMRNFTDKY